MWSASKAAKLGDRTGSTGVTGTIAGRGGHPSKDEIRAMLGHAQGRWRALIVTAIFTGLRASELPRAAME